MVTVISPQNLSKSVSPCLSEATSVSFINQIVPSNLSFHPTHDSHSIDAGDLQFSIIISCGLLYVRNVWKIMSVKINSGSALCWWLTDLPSLWIFIQLKHVTCLSDICSMSNHLNLSFYLYLFNRSRQAATFSFIPYCSILPFLRIFTSVQCLNIANCLERCRLSQ